MRNGGFCERLESLASCLPQRLFRLLCGVRPPAAVVEEGGKIAGFCKIGAALDVCGKPHRLVALAECRGGGFVGGLMCRVMEFSGYTAFDKKAARRLACGLRVAAGGSWGLGFFASARGSCFFLCSSIRSRGLSFFPGRRCFCRRRRFCGASTSARPPSRRRGTPAIR